MDTSKNSFYNLFGMNLSSPSLRMKWNIEKAKIKMLNIINMIKNEAVAPKKLNWILKCLVKSVWRTYTKSSDSSGVKDSHKEEFLALR